MCVKQEYIGGWVSNQKHIEIKIIISPWIMNSTCTCISNKSLKSQKNETLTSWNGKRIILTIEMVSIHLVVVTTDEYK